jgi:5'-nucleotidase
MAISLCIGPGSGRHFETAAEVAKRLVARLLSHPPQSAMILNVNVPDVPFRDIRGRP